MIVGRYLRHRLGFDPRRCGQPESACRKFRGSRCSAELPDAGTPVWTTTVHLWCRSGPGRDRGWPPARPPSRPRRATSLKIRL